MLNVRDHETLTGELSNRILQEFRTHVLALINKRDKLLAAARKNLAFKTRPDRECESPYQRAHVARVERSDAAVKDSAVTNERAKVAVARVVWREVERRNPRESLHHVDEPS